VDTTNPTDTTTVVVTITIRDRTLAIIELARPGIVKQARLEPLEIEIVTATRTQNQVNTGLIGLFLWLKF
jgi:hypothetical protein